MFMRQLKRWIRQSMVLDTKGAKRCPQPNGGVIWVINQAPQTVASSGIRLQGPNLELDPTAAVARGVVVYVSPQNPLATTGLFDLVINDNVLHTANPGWWIALKNVPAEVVNPAGYAAGTYYNVPAAPPQGATSGTPLKGDMDGANVYWGPWTPTAFC